MSFFRHREIFRSDVIRSVRERLRRRPRPHRLDEFPVGYSSAGCSPTLPASASPTGHHSALQSSCRPSVFYRTVSSVLTACLSSGGHPKLVVLSFGKPRFLESTSLVSVPNPTVFDTATPGTAANDGVGVCTLIRLPSTRHLFNKNHGRDGRI